MTNRLAQSQSLYLRKHAENPIDWWPWCEEALVKAQREDKPIFLSIGYSSCHWCTVMEGEAFSDPGIADYMNTYFLPIKVDREERPDLDSIYMQTVQMMTGQGGWPLNVFLTPDDRVPFYGGTYFPVEPKFGRPGFLQVLQAIRRFYDTEKAKLADQKGQLMHHLQGTTLLQPLPTVPESLLVEGIERNTAVISGPGMGPSFPMIPYATLALQGSRFGLDSRYDGRSACAQRGLDLVTGGIYDHVGGGFHRYTVDPTWTVPHFEKMLYDNGQIVEYLAQLWQAGVQEPAIEQAIAGTVNWLQREMTAEAGCFYAAQDADNFVTPEDQEPEEGRFYAWTFSELQELLTVEEFEALSQRFHITPEGNFEQGLIVLKRRDPDALTPLVEAALAKLFQVRYGALPREVPTFAPAHNNQEAKTGSWPGRIPPVTDTKMIVAWNSLMISGLATAYRVFGQPHYWALATRAANFILNQQWSAGRLQRLSYEGHAAVAAQSEDYAFLIKALLDLHQASLRDGQASEDWLQAALRVQREFNEYFWSLEGGYYNTASDTSEALLVRERSWMDNATPSANGVAIANLVRLALLSENLEYLSQAEQALKTFGVVLKDSPQGCPSLFTALDWYDHSTLVQTTPELLQSLLSQYYWPTVVYILATDLPQRSVGLVCQGLTCQEPAQTLAQLQEQVENLAAVL